MLLIIM